MIALLLANWRLVAELIVVGVLSAMLGVSRMELANDKAAIAKQNATASALLARIEATNAVKVATDAEYSRALDKVNTDAQKQISDSSSAYQRDTALKLQQLAASWKSRCSTRTAQAAAPDISATAESERIVRLSKEYGQVAGDIVGNARSIQAELTQCKVWAKEHGR